MNVHHPRGEAIKSTAIACLAAHWQYSFVSFNSSLTNTPVVFCSETVISLQNYPFQTGLSMLPLKKNIHPNFGQDLGKKSAERGTGTNASIETQQFEQKRFQDVALTRTHTHNLPLARLLPLGRGRCSRSAPARARRARVSATEPGTERVPAAWLLQGLPAAARTRHPLRPPLTGTHERPHAAAQGPLSPSVPPKAAHRSGAGAGELWGHPRPLARRRPKPAAGGEGRAAGPAFPLS